MWKSIMSLCFTLLFCSSMAFAQQGIAITGTVTDKGDPLPGVNVTVKGTTIGVVTNNDGKYQITVPNADAVLLFSFVGYLTTEMVVGAQREINIELAEDTQQLEEVVVVGYGVLKKKLVTGATIQVSGENLQKMSTPNAFTALQSQTPGVTIMQNNGQPGEGYIIHIRGIGTNGDSRPLYVVDGVASGNDALNNMSIADIETIDILKDAASSAIYGARAANGVVLITTKQGKAGKTRLSYDGYFGRQYMYKKPDLLNAKEYTMFLDEMRFNENQALYDWENILPYGMYDDVMSGRWKGTDWVDAFYNKGAITQSHSFNLTGGNDNSKFSIGYSYTQQDGIFGEAVQSKYDRNTFRINSDHVLLKVRDMEVIKIGETLNYSFRNKSGVATENMYWNSFRNVLNGCPLLPVYNDDGTYYDYASKVRDGFNFFPQNVGNPVGSTAKGSQGLNLEKNHNLNASVFVQIQPINGLIFKSQFGYQMNGGTYRSQSQISNWTNQNIQSVETVGQSAWMGYSWKLDNTLTYNFAFDRHNFTVQAGQAVEKSGFGENVGAGGSINIFDLGWNYAWVDNLKPTQLSERNASGSPWDEGAMASFWGRVMYNFRETYMLTLIMRADGSSNFDRGHRWGYFPSVSAGWIMSNESFMDATKGVLDFLKLTVNWGQNGNQAIPNFRYVSQYNFRERDKYYFGDTQKGSPTPYTGAIPGRLRNPNITWETSQMLDVGFDARFVNSRLGVTFNYYVKDTKDWLLTAPISGTWGLEAPTINGGAVQNKGVELMLTWNDRVGKFSYGVNLNGSYNKNEVTRIDNPEGVIHGEGSILSEGTGEFYRLQVGKPMGFFYGWKANGIFQNWNEINSYTSKEGDPIIPNAQPGDVRFVDTNGDGVINDDDRVMIGCGWPKYKMGFMLNLGYGGFDLSMTATGAFGMDLAKSYRSFGDNNIQNYTTQAFERWTGEGTSNKWPRMTTGSHPNYQKVSNIFIEKGDYVKIQNITVGYDFKKLLTQLPLGQLRLYFTAQNLFTFTGYTGMDPEIGYGNSEGWVAGIDLGYYPAPKTFLCGLNITF